MVQFAAWSQTGVSNLPLSVHNGSQTAGHWHH